MPRIAIGRGVCGGCLETRKLSRNPRGPIARCRRCLTQGDGNMTVDSLIEKLNDGWGWASFDVSLHGDGKWTASLQFVKVFDEKGEEIQQIQAKTFIARNAVKQFIRWLRGKRVCLRGGNGGADGPLIKVPKALKIPLVR